MTATTPDAQGIPIGQTRVERRVWARVLGAGLLAGLAAALAMTFVMTLLRDVLGIPSVAELIGDRVIPLLTLKQFFQLIDRFNGGSGIKKVGISSVLVGQV